MSDGNCALVLGGYVNGYSIIQELYEKHIENIIHFDTEKRLAAYSNKIKKFVLIDKSPECLREQLSILNKEYGYIIIYPTDDLHLENLQKIYDDVSSFCFLPFNETNLLECSKKYVQYKYCDKLGIPYPQTVLLDSIDNINLINTIQYPVLIKPNKRDDLKIKVFRNLELTTKEDFEKNRKTLEEYLNFGISFLASEIVPGDGSNIYAYVGYRSRNGRILSEWTGKKLSQYPDDYGVFSSASNQAPEQVLHQGRKLLEGMDLLGIAEPEFKYDCRDNKYKLMEINLRSMMWHRVGNLSDINIQYAQYLDAIGQKVEKQEQIKDIDIHYVYLKHELINLVMRKGYRKYFINNLFKSDRTYVAVYDISDIMPFLIDCRDMISGAILRCLRVLKTK